MKLKKLKRLPLKNHKKKYKVTESQIKRFTTLRLFFKNVNRNDCYIFDSFYFDYSLYSRNESGFCRIES